MRPRPNLTDYPIVLALVVRDEPDWLVADLLTNVSWVDGVSILRQPSAPGVGWQHEGKTRMRQRAQLEREYKRRPVWVLQLDPDERLDQQAQHEVALAIAAATPRTSIGFPLREMWTPTAYRADGEWARKLPRMRMFLFDPLGKYGAQTYRNKMIHQGILAQQSRERVVVDSWLCHLKSIEPANRVARADAYYAADPEFKAQAREAAGEGRDAWSWLHDETGLELVELPDARRFLPPYDRPYHFTRPGDPTCHAST